MKIHTTNYFNTFIEIAEDSPVQTSVIPTTKNEKKTLAVLQYEILSKHPYHFTSDDLLFMIHIARNEFQTNDLIKAKQLFFSKPQACFRTSPLPKKYGFGVHANEEGKLAIFGVETKEYKSLLQIPTIKKLKAMRSKK